MFDPKILDDLSKRLSESVPAGLREVRPDFDKNARAALQSALTKLDLVTREEFDVQTAVLARSRAMLDALAQRVAELEKQLLKK
jgi:ubiquinone biosynthesis accessory factor UbiK